MKSAFVLALLAVSSVARGETVDTATTKSAVLAADRALAARVHREGAAAFLAAIDPDAAILLPGQPILTGSKGARNALLVRYGSPSSYTWTPVHAVASSDGRFACTMGYSRFSNALDSVKTPRIGTYLTCWRRNSKGKWRIAGAQRADSPQKGPVLADSAVLPAAPHSAVASVGSAQLRAAQDADSLFAVMGAEAAGPGPAFAKYSAEDAFLLGGDEFPRGPQQISAAFEGYSPDRVIWWRPVWKMGYGSGGLAFTVGNSTSGPRAGKTGPTNYNKYFTVWRQEPDGSWLYIFDLGSPRPPA